jgi:hypothetical protein
MEKRKKIYIAAQGESTCQNSNDGLRILNPKYLCRGLDA